MIPLVDQAKENTCGEHAAVIADCGFNSYEVMQTIEEERTEEFYVPDRLFESSKSEEEGKGEYCLDRFQRDEDGGIRCPLGHEMKHTRREDFEDGHHVDIWEGTACGQCAHRDKCTRQAKRRISYSAQIK